MNADWLNHMADFTLLLSLALLFIALVTAMVDAFLEEVDVRDRLNERKEQVVADGARLREQLFIVRHIPSLISAGATLLTLALILPRLAA